MYFQSPSVVVAWKARCCLLRYTTHFEVWKLGNTDVDLEASQQVLPLSEDVKTLLYFQSHSDGQIRCASISSDLRWVAYSTDTLFRLLTCARVCTITFCELFVLSVLSLSQLRQLSHFVLMIGAYQSGTGLHTAYPEYIVFDLILFNFGNLRLFILHTEVCIFKSCVNYLKRSNAKKKNE